MAREKKKFSRKDMKRPDEFIKKTFEFSEWAGDHARQIIIITSVVIGTILIGALAWSWNQSREIKSSKQMESVFKVTGREVVPTEYGSAPPPSGDDETYGSLYHKDEALLKAFREARDNARTSAVKKASTLGIASTLLALGKFEAARKEYQSLAADPSGMTGMLHFIYEGLGFTYEGLGKKKEALEQYKKLETCEDGAYKQLGLYHQARLYEAEGKKEEARKLYARIAADINAAQEMSPLLAFLQEKISDKEGVDLSPSFFKGSDAGFGGPGAGGGELTPEKIEQLKKQLELLKKQQDLEAAAKQKAEDLKEALEGGAQEKAPAGEKKAPAEQKTPPAEQKTPPAEKKAPPAETGGGE
jgi:tetratricopeptide (TPR) repeat protein